MEHFCILIVVVIAWIYAYDKILWNYTPKTVHVKADEAAKDMQLSYYYCTNVSFLVLTMYYGSARYHWGKLGIGYARILYYFCNFFLV